MPSNVIIITTANSFSFNVYKKPTIITVVIIVEETHAMSLSYPQDFFIGVGLAGKQVENR